MAFSPSFTVTVHGQCLHSRLEWEEQEISKAEIGRDLDLKIIFSPGTGVVTREPLNEGALRSGVRLHD